MTSADTAMYQPPPLPFTDTVPLDVAEPRGGLVAAALFGAPLDRTESFRVGAAAGPDAVRQISGSLETYSPSLDRDVTDLTLVDLGNLPLGGETMDADIEAIATAIEHATGVARLGVMLAGEHTATLGGYRGVLRRYPDAMLIQVDAHLDIRDQYEGVALTHASWVYHAGMAHGFDRIVQLGVRSGAREEWPVARGQTAWSSPDLFIPPGVRSRLARHPLYITIDIDVLDPSAAPGTGCPEPGGVTFRELATWLYGMAGLRVVGFDVVEVAPHLDPSGITAVAAAKLVREAMLLFGTEE